MHKHQVPKHILQNRNITLRLIIVINISLAAPCPKEYGAVNLRIVPPPSSTNFTTKGKSTYLSR